jgi:hypothetical protein
LFLCSTNLALNVRGVMKAEEDKATEEEQTCVALYAHWFVSLLGLAEGCARLLVHLFIVGLACLLYYAVYCLSCGKTSLNVTLAFQMSRCSLYAGLVMAMLGNLCTPWKPPLYMYPRKTTLARPVPAGIHAADGFNSALDVESACASFCCCCCNAVCGLNKGYCVCCGIPPESALPPYKLVQVSLSSVGCCRAGTGCYKCLGGPEADAKIKEQQEEVARETADATRQFYLRHYDCASFEELVEREVFGRGRPAPAQQMQKPHVAAGMMPMGVSSAAAPSAPSAPVVYAQAYAVPVQQAQPVPAAVVKGSRL